MHQIPLNQHPQSTLTKTGLSVSRTMYWLKKERRHQGITQTTLATKTNMTQPQLAKLEQLDSTPSLDTLNRYADALGLKVSLSIHPQKPIE